MGSAFPAEAWVYDAPAEVRRHLVTFLFRLDGDDPDPWVAHRHHPECGIEAPHRMSECVACASQEAHQ